MSTDSNTQRNKIRIRWWHIVLIVIVVAAFFGLAYWQWTRFQSGSGTFQNLGYALQWPAFAVFVIYAYRTALSYENERIAAENEAAEMGQEEYTYVAPDVQGQEGPKAIDESFLPKRTQMDVEEFNALNRRRRGQHDENQRL